MSKMTKRPIAYAKTVPTFEIGPEARGKQDLVFYSDPEGKRMISVMPYYYKKEWPKHGDLMFVSGILRKIMHIGKKKRKKMNQREPFWQVFNIYTYSAPLSGMLFHGQISGKDLSTFEVRRRGADKYDLPLQQVKIQEVRWGEKPAPIR